jgi:hypothetical protein
LSTAPWRVAARLVDAGNTSAVSIFSKQLPARGKPRLEQQETGQGWNAMNRGIE